MTAIQNRQPRGISEGGQFVASVNPESTLELVDDDTGWGDVTNVREGSRTPWGTADHVWHSAPGIVQVGTPSHGGIKLSPERNKMIPSPLRRQSGWYEEDCESNIVGMYHPEGFTLGPNWTIDDMRESSRRGTADWFPDEFEKVTGTMLSVGESSVKDDRTWHARYANDLVAVSASGDWQDGVPDGMVAVTVTPGGGRDGESWAKQRELLVPEEDYADPANRHALGKFNGSFVVDPSKDYQDITPPPKAPEPPATRYRDIDYSGLTERQRVRAREELSRRYRFGGEQDARSLQQIVDDGGIEGKYFRTENGRRKYYLQATTDADDAADTGSFFRLDVSKALYDAVRAPGQECG